MGKPKFRYVAKAVPGSGWRVWNRQSKRWWGNFFQAYPQELLDELNGPKRQGKIVELCKRK